MPDLVINPNDVRESSVASATVEIVQLGEPAVAGVVLYRVGGIWRLAECDDDTSEGAIKAGSTGLALALSSGTTDQKIVAAKSGDVVLGNILDIGKIYLLSSNPGKIMPVDDYPGTLVRPRLVILGYAVSTNTMRLNFNYTGVRRP